MTTIIKRILEWLLKESETELRAIYQTDVVDCHPFSTPVPITFEKWKATR